MKIFLKWLPIIALWVLQWQEKIRRSNWRNEYNFLNISSVLVNDLEYLLFLPYKDISNKIHFRREGDYLFVIGYLVATVRLRADCFQKVFLYIVEYFKPALCQITITISCRNSSAVCSRRLKYQWLSVKTPGMSWDILLCGGKNPFWSGNYTLRNYSLL